MIYDSFCLSSKNIQLFNFPSKDDYQKQRPWLSSSKTTLTRQLSSIESSTSNDINPDNGYVNVMQDKNNTHDPCNPYQRSISIDNATMDGYTTRSSRALSVEPNLISGGHDIKYLYQQKSLPTGSSIEYEDATMSSRPFTSSSETMDHSS